MLKFQNTQLCGVTHLPQKERTLHPLDWCFCLTCPAGAAGSCRGRCPQAGAAAGSGWRPSRRVQAQTPAGPSEWGTESFGAAVSGRPPPRGRGPLVVSESRLPQPIPRYLGCDTEAQLTHQYTSVSGQCPPSPWHLQGEEGIKLDVI